MKKILATLAITAISTAAFAGVTFDGRFDYASDTSNSITSTNQTGTSGFAWNFAKMGFAGKASDSVTMKAKLNFLGSGNLHANGKNMAAGYNGTGSGNDNFASSDLVESAYVSHKISDSLTATCGKYDSGMSGFEGQESSISQYFTSAGYNYPRVTGVNFNYEFSSGKNLVFALFNGTAAYATDKTRMGAGLIYTGNYGNVGVIASYHLDPQGSNGTDSLDNTYTTVGLSYKMDMTMFKFDYDSNITGKAATGTAHDKTVNAMVLSVHHDMGNGWVPGLKVESSTKKAFQTTGTTDADITLTNFAIFGDYKANSADNFGYHLAYVSKASAYSSKAAFSATNDNVTQTLAYAGITYTGDFMK